MKNKLLKLMKNTHLQVLAAVIAAVVLYVVSFPRLNCFWAAFFFLVPLLYVCGSGKTKRGFWIFFLFSFFSYLGILYWIPAIMSQYGGAGKFLSIVGLVALAAFLSLFSGWAGMLIRLVLPGAAPAHVSVKAGIFLIPFIWVAKDLVVERVLSGFPWCSAGYSQHNNIYFIQSAELGGIHLITFFVIFINILVYLLLTEKGRRKRIAAALVITFLGIYTTGYFLYKNNEKQTAPLPIHKAGIIQPNAADSDRVVTTAKQHRRLNRLFSLSRELKNQGAEFVVWPEYTVSILPLQHRFYQDMFMSFAAADIPVIAGFNDHVGRGEFYNTAFLFKKDQVETYYKVHLTPFGEYVPLRKMLFFVQKITDEIGDYSFGKSIHNFTIDNHSISVPICYEVIFPGLIRDFVSRGSELLVTISNDNWEGNTAGPRQILSMAAFRCIENRRYMLRSTSTGISAAITPGGTFMHRSQWGVEDAFIAQFKYIKKQTVFTRFGYLFPFWCVLIVFAYMLALVSRIVLRRKQR